MEKLIWGKSDYFLTGEAFYGSQQKKLIYMITTRANNLQTYKAFCAGEKMPKFRISTCT